jgi:hypothetical protein
VLKAESKVHKLGEVLNKIRDLNDRRGATAVHVHLMHFASVEGDGVASSGGELRSPFV